jgi:hypothetical protein
MTITSSPVTRTRTELEAVELRWNASPNHDFHAFERLVDQTEDIIIGEVSEWSRHMARVLEEEADRQRAAHDRLREELERGT